MTIPWFENWPTCFAGVISMPVHQTHALKRSLLKQHIGLYYERVRRTRVRILFLRGRTWSRKPHNRLTTKLAEETQK